MNRKLKGVSVIIAVIFAFTLIAGTVSAAFTQQNIEVSSGVTIYVDGDEFIPKDGNGNVVEAFIHNGTTFLPLRALAEMLGLDVDWDGDSGSVYIGGAPNETIAESPAETALQPNTANSADAAVVYFTSDLSPEGLIAAYEALGREASGNVAVKISTGEPGSNYFLQPALIADLVQMVDGTIVESNTAYAGPRASTAMHYQVAEDHGFTAIAPVVILDEGDTISLPVTDGKHLKEDIVGERFNDYDFHVVLSHFKGHGMAGFGGALKNMSIGYASAAGKNNIHSGGTSLTSWGASQDDFLESMAEATGAVIDAVGEDNILYINVLNNLSVDCDCSSNPRAPEIHDLGILASLDPVALDRASVDMIYAVDDAESASLKERIESRNATHILDYAAEIGLGRLAYQLVSID